MAHKRRLFEDSAQRRRRYNKRYDASAKGKKTREKYRAARLSNEKHRDARREYNRIYYKATQMMARTGCDRATAMSHIHALELTLGKI